MSYNAKDLAQRDPALAALVGAQDGADFGADPNHPSFGAEPGFFSWDAPGAEYYGYNPIGAEGFFAGNFGTDGPPPKPTPEQALALWNKTHAQARETARREALLNPNANSTKKVERYSLSIRQNLVVGTASTFTVTKNPQTELRPQRIETNVPSPGFCIITDVKVANVSVMQGDGMDAWELNPTAWGVQYDIPTLSPANGVTVSVEQSTAVPSGFDTSDAFPFMISFLGPSSMAG
jgi:hypothetical protein